MKLLFMMLIFPSILMGQELPARWDELTASDWPKALEKSDRTCILPIGILEKHGPHAPLGTDLIHVREVAARAVKKEYAVVFPDYFYGQINEAKHQPGTFSLPSDVIWDLLQATCDEIGRNGFNKILILNGHGGNPEFLRFFMQSQLRERHNYAVYLYIHQGDSAFNAEVKKLRKTDADTDLHAGEYETSVLLYLRPDLMQMDRTTHESGAKQERLNLSGAYTPIWWYAAFPNHYAGEGNQASKELGQLAVEHEIASFTRVLKMIKADKETLKLQDEYFNRVEKLGE